MSVLYIYLSSLYEKNSYYIIGVLAEKITESTLLFGDEKTPLPIRDKVINDMILKKGESVTGEYYGDMKM